MNLLVLDHEPLIVRVQLSVYRTIFMYCHMRLIAPFAEMCSFSVIRLNSNIAPLQALSMGLIVPMIKMVSITFQYNFYHYEFTISIP